MNYKLLALFLVCALLFSLVFPLFSFAASSEEDKTFWDVLSEDWANSMGAAGALIASLGGADSETCGNIYNACRYNWGADPDSGYQWKFSGTGATSSGATNNYAYNDNSVKNTYNQQYTTTNNNQTYYSNTYRVLNKTDNTWYNPVTNEYTTVNNIKYSPTYNTYYIESNTYNTYITNNYTYVSYYITNNVTNETNYYEIYYTLPDGRNTYTLTPNDVKGIPMVYNVQNAPSVAEDDGQTLGLFHLDGDKLDSSAAQHDPLSSPMTTFVGSLDGFDQCLSGSAASNFSLGDMPEGPWTLEFMAYSTAVFDVFLPFRSNTSTPRITYDSGSTVSYNWTATLNPSLGTAASSTPSPHSCTAKCLVKNGSVFYTTSSSQYSVSGPANQWNYFQLCFDGNVLTIYVNGIKNRTVSLDAVDKTSISFYTKKHTWSSQYSWTFNYLPLGVTDTFYMKAKKVYCPQYLSDCATLGYDETYLNSHSIPTEFFVDSQSFDKTTTYAKDSQLTFSFNKPVCIDEVRLSNKVLYTGNTSTYRSQPFDTNFVNVLPESPVENDVVIFGNIDITDIRFGGVRPTYPEIGNVWVSLDNSQVVQSIQLFDGSAWSEVDARLYTDNQWVDFKGYDTTGISLPANPTENPGPDDPGPDDPGPDDPGGDDKPTTWSKFFEAVGNFFKTIGDGVGSVLTGIVNGLTSIVSSIGDLIAGTLEWGTGFSSFMGEFFSWVPSEIITVICAGVVVMIGVAVIKFIRG